MAARVSKNAREGKRSVQNKHVCANGHEQVRVKVVPVKGSARLYWMCACDGYTPIQNVVVKR